MQWLTYKVRPPGADMDLPCLRLGHSKGLLKERFRSMDFTRILKYSAKQILDMHCTHLHYRAVCECSEYYYLKVWGQ